MSEADEISQEDLEAAAEFYDREIKILGKQLIKGNGKQMKIPTPEQVKRAAEKCPQAREVLAELFPDVFENLTGVVLVKIGKFPGEWELIINNLRILHTETHQTNRIFLSDDFIWRLDNTVSGRQFVEIVSENK